MKSIPVPGRSCGSCTVCCKVLEIREGEFHKPAEQMCVHCNGAGCGIYESRPVICRTFHCGWRQDGNMGAGWRPDRSGVLLLPAEAAEGCADAAGVEMMIVGGEAAIDRPGFAEFAVALVRARITVFLSENCQGETRKMLLNAAMPVTAAAGDMAAVRAILKRILAHIRQVTDSAPC